MPNLVIPTGYAQIGLGFKHDLSDHRAFITFGIRWTSEDPFDAGFAANNAVIAWGANMENLISDEVTLDRTTFTSQLPSGEYVGGSTVYNVAMQGTLNSQPSNVACLIEKRTTRLGRAGRGRWFLPWCLDDADVNEAGSINSGALTLIGSGVTGFLDDMNAAETPLVILHTATAPGGTTPSDVTALVPQAVVATQRRRVRS